MNPLKTAGPAAAVVGIRYARAIKPLKPVVRGRRTSNDQMRARDVIVDAIGDGVGGFLTDTISHLFETSPNKVDWKRVEFEGKISHDDHSRLRKINKVLQKAIDDGVPDDAAPSAQAAAKEPASPEQAARVQGFLQGAVERVFSNSQTSDFEHEWKSAPFDGDITSQREIWRMLHVAKVVEETMKKKQQDAK